MIHIFAISFLQELLNREGLYTGNRLIFCMELFEYEIIIALFKQSENSRPLVTGVICEFSAVWNEYEKKFIVTKYNPKRLKTPIGINGLLLAKIRTVEDYPGVFESACFGLVDDPRGVLSLLHLSPFKNCSIVVTLEDKPSMSQFRFRIVDVQRDKAANFQKWIEKAEIAVQNVDGIILDFSTVYSRAHGDIFFYLPEGLRENTFPGKLIKFSAQYQYDMKRFIITELFFLTENVDIVSVERPQLVDAPQNCQRAFRILAARSHTFNGFLEHDVFGLVDMGTHILPTDDYSRMDVWVMRSVPDMDQTTRSARAPFVVVSMGDQEPDEDVIELRGRDEIHDLQEVITVDLNRVTQKAMERMKLTEIMDLSPHVMECTDTICTANCPILEMIMMIVDTVPNFMNLLSAEDSDLLKRCLNHIFS